MASNKTQTASSIDSDWPQRIFGVGQTFSNVSEALRSISATATAGIRRQIGVEGLGGIRAEYGMLRR